MDDLMGDGVQERQTSKSRVYPDLSAGSKSAGTLDSQALDTDTVVPASIQWSIEIEAVSDDLFDSNNRLGVSTGTSREWDTMDRPEPPQFEGSLSLYFPHDDWLLFTEHALTNPY